MVDITKDLETVDSEPEEDVTPLDEKLLREGLQLSGKTKITQPPENFEVAAGNSATFRCNAEADTSLALTIQWRFNGQQIDFDQDPRIVQASDNSLTISKTLELDSGVFTCVAQTELDKDEARAILTVQEESDDEYIDFDDEIDDPDFQDPAHNLQYSSDSDECEMDIDHDTIPQNEKNSDALSDTDAASLSSVDEMPSANASGYRPILWFHADSTFQPRMTIPAESLPSLLFNLNRSATELNVFLKFFPESYDMDLSMHKPTTQKGTTNNSPFRPL
ncbi:neuroglian [Trichonephila clavipes]|uniref:Neuroglian n=1 Tax=Trichonephila clavipes TaxID=2585209 RepID=A0A8X6S9V2_TRICX|nr:neuroglian [Trichonephila clavipes]